MRKACIEEEKKHIVELLIVINEENYIKMSNDM